MQDRFPPRYHSSRPDSSEDTPENSSPRSVLLIGSLLKGNNMFIETIIISNFVFYSIDFKEKSKTCFHLNVLNYYKTPFNIFNI